MLMLMTITLLQLLATGKNVKSPSCKVARNPIFNSCGFIFFLFKVKYMEKLDFITLLYFLSYFKIHLMSNDK